MVQKRVEITIPSEKMSILDELNAFVNVERETMTSKEKSLVSCVIDGSKLGIMLEELKSIGIGTVFGHVVVFPVDAYLSAKSKQIEKTRKAHTLHHGTFCADTIMSNSRMMGELSPSFVFMVVLASGLAGFGLLNDSVVIIIACMIIAPDLGPIAQLALAAIVPERMRRRKALLAEALNLVTCIAVGMAIGLAFPLPPGPIPQQIIGFINPGVEEVFFAILTGTAAGIFIAKGADPGIVGVAVAASLCPPATNIGLMLASARFAVAMDSLTLWILNFAAIYAACTIIFWISHVTVKGGSMSGRQLARATRQQRFQTASAVAILIAVIVFVFAA